MKNKIKKILSNNNNNNKNYKNKIKNKMLNHKIYIHPYHLLQ